MTATTTSTSSLSSSSSSSSPKNTTTLLLLLPVKRRRSRRRASVSVHCATRSPPHYCSLRCLKKDGKCRHTRNKIYCIGPPPVAQLNQNKINVLAIPFRFSAFSNSSALYAAYKTFKSKFIRKTLENERQLHSTAQGQNYENNFIKTTFVVLADNNSTRFVLLPVIKQIKPKNSNEDDEDEYLPELPTTTTTTSAPQLLSARLAELDTETETDEEEMAALTQRVKQKLLQIYRIKQERQRLLLEQQNNNSVVELRHDEPLPYFSWSQQQNSSSSSSRRRRSLMYAEVYPSAHAQQQQSLPIMTRTTLTPSSPPSTVPYPRRHYVYKNNRRYRTASKTAPRISSATSRPALVFPTYNNRTAAQDLLFSTRRLENNNYENQNRVQQVEPTTTTTAKPTAATRSRRKLAFAIYNEATKSYVCLNRQNKPIARRKFKSMQCLFERIDSFPSKTYTRFRLLGDSTDGGDNVVGSSDINDHALFLGFDAHGRGELASTLKRQYRRWRLAQQPPDESGDGTESAVEETFLPSLHGKALERCFEFRVDEQTLLLK